MLSSAKLSVNFAYHVVCKANLLTSYTAIICLVDTPSQQFFRHVGTIACLLR